MISRNVSWADYQQITRMNPSKLVRGCKSMKSLKRAIDDGFSEPTDAMRMGSGLHCLLLESDQFEDRYCVIPDFHKLPDNVTAQGKPTDSKATNFYKNKVKEYASENAGREFVSRDQYDTMLCAIESLRGHAEASRLIESCGSNLEITVLGEISGVEFKGRIDALSPQAIIDLKTTATVDTIQFGRTFANLKYGMKLAIYRELIRQSSTTRDVRVIAQEMSGDFDTVVFDVPDCVLDAGLAAAKLIIEDYRHSLKTGEWHGVDRGEKTVQLVVPNWSMPSDAEEAAMWHGASVESETEAAF